MDICELRGHTTDVGQDSRTYAAELAKAVKIEDGKRTSTFSNYMRTKRDDAGFSIREAARRASISEARWRQLESGYQVVRGERIPAKPTEETVFAIASALDMHPDLALQLAGIITSVQVSATGIWPLPKVKKMKRDPQTGNLEVSDPYVQGATLRKARMRLRNLQRLDEQIVNLPTEDLEYLRDTIEGYISDRYQAEEELKEKYDAELGQMHSGYSENAEE